MKSILQIIIMSIGLLLGQTAEQIRQAKEVIQRTGMSESQARDAAKSRGYTDKQIDAAIQNAKESEARSKKSLPEVGKSNENVQEF